MNRFPNLFAATLVVMAMAVHCAPTEAAGVTVGSSTLINYLDYSDSFTITSQGGIPGRTGGGAFPVGLPGINVENDHGNLPQNWTNALWSIAEDGTVSDPAAVYVGSGAGTLTGVTQTGGQVDYGIDYGLADEFIVQFDAFQAPDRIDITAASSRNTIVGGLSVFFRTDNHPSFPEIGLYNGVSEINSGLASPILSKNEWHNYAVRFDMLDSEIEVFVDEVSLGVVDLAVLNGGSHNTINNAAVSVGGTATDGSRFWSDNFQVGTLVPVAAKVGTMLSLSTDVLNEGNAARMNFVDGYNNNGTDSTVDLVRFIGNADTSPINVAYNQNGDTIDVSPWVVSGPARGAGQQLASNGYGPIGGSSPVGTSNLYLRGEPDVNNEGFGAHANWIITFDLDDIRANMLDGFDLRLRLTGEFGAWGAIGSADPGAGIVQGVIFLDGVRIDSMAETIANPAAVNQSFDLILDSGRWLTFGIFNGDGAADTTLWDDGLFQNVKLTAIPTPAALPAGLALIALTAARRRRTPHGDPR